jgi:hypothetical protein
LYLKTSEKKHEGHANIEIEKEVYIANEAERIQLKTAKEFFEKFEIFKNNPKEIQKKLFQDEEQQEAFLKRVTEEYENIKVTDSTELLNLEDKIYELAYLNKMEKGASYEELNKLEEEFEKIYQEIEINYKKDEE